MSITVDELMDVQSDEERGRVVRVVRKLKLSGVVASAQMSAIAQVLASSLIPTAGSFILVNDSVLYLTGRSPRMTEASTLAEVILTYEGGTSSAAGNDELRRGGRSSLAQVRTVNDRQGNLVTVRRGGAIFGEEQAGEFTVFQPQATPFIETVESTDDPDALLEQWIGRTNSSTWRGKAKGRWLVSNVEYDEMNPGSSPALWRFRWSFLEAIESQGWLPVAAFVDPTTNRIPDDLEEGVGIKSVPWYYKRDFNTKFR